MNDFRTINFCGRRRGKTAATCKAAREINGTVVVRDWREAKRVAAEYGVNAVSIDRDLRGTRGPYLIDPDAVGIMVGELMDEVGRLQKKLNAAEEKLRKIEDIL